MASAKEPLDESSALLSERDPSTPQTLRIREAFAALRMTVV